MIRVLTLFGTRPEVIKLAPVIHRLETDRETFATVNVTSGQHDDLLQPFIRLFRIRVDHDLRVMRPGQTPNEVCARVLAALDPLLDGERPDLLLVQGDTTTALAGALAGFHRGIPVGHVEAGLRSGDPLSPYPEEMNRRLIGRLATWHFAATVRNREALVREGVDPNAIEVTGNPVVDAVLGIVSRPPSALVADVLAATKGLRRVLLTTHRRESFGRSMRGNLRVLRGFVEAHEDTALIFPVHPNPSVTETTHEILAGHPRIRLLEPLAYEDFIFLMSEAWLLVSDSGGVQEEAPTLGKPLLVIRENTERPEAVEAGVARLVGGDPERLRALLEEGWRPGSWVEAASPVANPFGNGDAGEHIARAIARWLRPDAKAAAPHRPKKERHESVPRH